MTGQLIGVVGPSGVGKDRLMTALAESGAGFSLVRRVITRKADLGGEDFEHVSEPEFELRRHNGAFCLNWSAHGLRYGIPDEVRVRASKGERLLANLSRDVLPDAAKLFADFCVLHVTASPDTIAKRLADRGRETIDDIKRRLARASAPLPSNLTVHTVENNGALEQTVFAALALLQPDKG